MAPVLPFFLFSRRYACPVRQGRGAGPGKDRALRAHFWAKLSADRKAEQCGWLKDKYGLSWQVTPAILQQLLGGDDNKRIDRVTQAFLKMKKFDIAALKRAAAG